MPDLSVSRPATTLRDPAPPGRATSGPSLPAPVPARRLRRPSWKDPRLLVGVALVLGSVVAGALVLSTAGDTVPVYAAARPLAPGDALAASDLTVVSVRLGDRQARYLSAAAGLPPDRVLVRAVSAGDLVPLSAVGARDQVDLRPVSVPVPAEGSERLDEGVLVDVWVADRDPEAGTASYTEPRQVAASVQVAGRSTRQGALGSSTSTAVQLLLGRSLLPQVIQAVDNAARITLVPVPATLSRDGS